MLLFRPYSYGHRANPEFADLSSRSLRNADGRFHRRNGQLDGGVKPEKVGREYAWQSWPELARLPAAIACLPNSITPLVDHSLNVFFYVAEGRDWSPPEAHVHYGPVFNTHGRCSASKDNSSSCADHSRDIQ